MRMTVKELIAELKQWPAHYQVGATAHDNDAGELQGYVRAVSELEPGRDYDPEQPTVILQL